jgi:hypothetical protein
MLAALSLPPIMQFEHMTEQELDEHAAHAAEYFWWTVRKNLDGITVCKSDLMAVLKNSNDADFAFGLFDLDGDGYVIQEEVHARFQKIYRFALMTGLLMTGGTSPLIVGSHPQQTAMISQ